MKVISSSIEGWTLEIMCKGCSSLLEIEAGDVKCSSRDRDRNYRIVHNYHVICSVCDSVIELENLPKPVELKAKNKKNPSTVEDVYDDLLDGAPDHPLRGVHRNRRDTDYY